MQIEKDQIEKWKEENCEECNGSYSCTDLCGDLIDEQVKICMEANL